MSAVMARVASPFAAPAASLGVRWSLMDVCGPVVRYMGQVKAGVGHTGNRFSEPVAIARGLGAGVFASIATNLLGKGLAEPSPARRNCKAGRQSEYGCCVEIASIERLPGGHF